MAEGAGLHVCASCSKGSGTRVFAAGLMKTGSANMESVCCWLHENRLERGSLGHVVLEMPLKNLDITQISRTITQSLFL